MLVIDAGAGTTDFAMFQSFYGTGEESFALIANSVRMSRIAGNRFDSFLKPLILRACSVHPENGSPWGDEEFSIIKADLAAQIRSLKRALFADGSTSISLRPGASGVLKLDGVMSDDGYLELEQELVRRRDELLTAVFTAQNIEEYRRANLAFGRPVPIYVVLSGGSARIPAFEKLAIGKANIGGATFEFRRISDVPRWVRDLPRDLSQLTAQEFPQCSVAIGGSSPELPREQHDLGAPITEPRRREWRLDRMQITGM
jgi:hypothetical protein